MCCSWIGPDELRQTFQLFVGKARHQMCLSGERFLDDVLLRQSFIDMCADLLQVPNEGFDAIPDLNRDDRLEPLKAADIIGSICAPAAASFFDRP